MLLNKNKSKWIPLMTYLYAGNSYMILCRKNLKTGMLYFKVKRLNAFAPSYQKVALDINKQFQIIMDM